MWMVKNETAVPLSGVCTVNCIHPTLTKVSIDIPLPLGSVKLCD